MESVNLDGLIQIVRRQAPAGPLEQVAAAQAVANELASGADDLIGYFVEQARDRGCSWTEIGQRLGVSKQAARQRFAVSTPVTRPRLRACLGVAEREAADDGAPEIGTHHQLLGLFREGVAAAALEKLGLNVDGVRAVARQLFPGGQPRGDPPPPNSLEARDALERAASLSRQGGCGEVGTEHLLAAIAFDPGSKARRVLGQLGFDFSALKKELACSLEGDRPRRRRRAKFDAGDACSFCGKRRGRELRCVAGPGVLICEECVRLCDEILSAPAPN